MQKLFFDLMNKFEFNVHVIVIWRYNELNIQHLTTFQRLLRLYIIIMSFFILNILLEYIDKRVGM